MSQGPSTEDPPAAPSPSPGLRERLRGIDLRVFLLVLVFGSSAWIELSGVFMEMPVMVHTQPEGWKLPSYLVIIIQASAIAPICYTVINKLCPGDLARRELVSCVFIISLSILTCVLLIFFWPYTLSVAGAEHSVPLLLLVAVLCLKASMSNVLYFPHMAKFKEGYMPVFMAGEGAGGLVVGLLGMAQGSGEYHCQNYTTWVFNDSTGLNTTQSTLTPVMEPPRFSVSVYFVILSCYCLMAGVAFIMLNYSAFCRKERVDQGDNSTKEIANGDPTMKDGECTVSLLELNSSDGENSTGLQENTDNSSQDSSASKQRTSWRLIVAYSFNGIGSFFVYGFEPSVRSYACLPYGQLTFNLGVRLKILMSPFFALLPLFFKTSSLRVIGGLLAGAVGLVGYIFYLATQSPTPPLHDHIMGPILVVIALVTLEALFTYGAALTACLVRAEGDHHSMMYAGFAYNIGATMGGVLSFVLVSVVGVLEDKPPCSGL